MTTDTPTHCLLSRYQSLLWSIAADIGGRTRTLLVDTGAGVTCLAPSIVAELGLASIGRRTGTRMSGQEVTFELHAGPRLHLSGAEIACPRVAALDLAAFLPSDWPPVDGVLALDALERRAFTLDLAQLELILETRESLRERVQGMRGVSMRIHRQIEDATVAVQIEVTGSDGTLWFTLDNSNTGPVVVTPASAVALGIEPGSDPTTPHEFPLPGFGSLRSPAVIADIIYDGNLGRTVLDGRALTFDLTNERLWATDTSVAR